MPNTLHAPWRMDYIRSLENADQSEGGCFLCQAIAALGSPEQRHARLVLWDTPLSIVVINKFPYTNGHVLVSPRSHVGSIEELSADELTDLQMQTVAVVRLLKKVMSPQGFNIGINQGRCAGAGLPGHLHQHIVPRWGGDVNFMSVVGNVRVQPQAMEQLYVELVTAKSACMDQL